jgi:hypothetical protein
MPKQEKNDIKKALADPSTLVATLAKHQINYILLAKDDDADTYHYLDTQAGVTVAAENDTLKLYRVTP